MFTRLTSKRIDGRQMDKDLHRGMRNTAAMLRINSSKTRVGLECIRCQQLFVNFHGSENQ